jgi:hypothetical protein
MYIRVGYCDFSKSLVKGKTLKQLKEMFPHIDEAVLKELHTQVGKK